MPLSIDMCCLRRLLTLLALIASPSHAAIYSVGAGAGCTHNTIQAAIDAAETSAGADTIRIARNLAYAAQALVITTGQELSLVGGFATCTQADVDATRTTLSGAGGATEPVMRINGNNGSIVTLLNLVISGGDEDGGGYGGGIYYRGNGVLKINESAIINNIAGSGGGVYAEGTGPTAKLIIGSNVTIASNTARGSGGGIYVDSLEMTMIAPDSILALNTAQGSISGGYGGGLLVNSINYPANAYVASTGQGNLGAIYGNVATRGGGVAVVASNDNSMSSKLQLYSTETAKPLRLIDNSATKAGGAIYVKPRDISVNSSPGLASVRAWQTYIEDNHAADGAAIYLDYDGSWGGYFHFNEDNLPSGAAPCPIGRPCGRIDGNEAVDNAGQVTSGSVFYGNSRSMFDVRRVAITGNRAARLLHITGDEPYKSASLDNTLVADNVTSFELIRMDRGELNIDNTTITANTIGAAQVATVSDVAVDIARSILSQPGKTLLVQSGGTRLVTDVIGNEVVSLGGGPQAFAAAPRFVDPARGDYSLRAASPAVDFGPAIDGNDTDMNSRVREQDLPIMANFRGPRDIGALERQSLLPLVLNQDFDADLNLWPLVTANSVTWDGSQSAVGSGTGSAHVLFHDPTQARVIAASQCIQLPGPALYALNGWGRSFGSSAVTRDKLLLYWEFRNNGGDACNGGPPTSHGDHLLTTADTWTRPTIPAYIDVPIAAFTNNSSITVYLVVVDSSVLPVPDHNVNGWFDGITLEPATDVIFQNGFD